MAEDFFRSALNLITNPLKAWDEFKNGRNYEISQNNLGFQRENLDYEKALQKQIFEREDTAYQRTVADMRQAGMNPLAMQGTNGAGEAIQTEPMNNNFSDNSNLSAISQIFNTINQISATRNNASLQQSQANLINAQADNQRIKNLYEEDILKENLAGLNLSNVGKKFQNEISNIDWLNKQEDYNFNNMYGLTENMPDIVKMSALMSGQKIYNREFSDFRRNFDTLGNTLNSYSEKPNSTNFLDSQQLKGAILENNIINGLLSLIPMGLGSLFKR